MKRYLPCLVGLAVLTVATVGMGPARAQSAFHIHMDTSSLTSLASSHTFALEFQFADGSGDATPDSNNLATLSNLTYGVGGSGPGSIAALSDGLPPFSGYAAPSFTPGSALDFDLALTGNPDLGASASPDSFSFSILEDGSEIATNDPSLGNALVTLTEPATTGGAIVAESFTYTTPAGGSVTPTITPQVTSANAPEPSGALLILGASMCLPLGWRRR